MASERSGRKKTERRDEARSGKRKGERREEEKGTGIRVESP